MDGIKIPEKDGQYKFMVFDYENEGYLRFLKLNDETFHNDIVQNFMKEIDAYSEKEIDEKKANEFGNKYGRGGGFCLKAENMIFFDGKSQEFDEYDKDFLYDILKNENTNGCKYFIDGCPTE